MRILKNKKGFTLVEVIVVLVILAILAALLVPSLSGYIDRANSRAIESSCRMAVVAAQTILAEEYAKNNAVTAISPAEVLKLAELEGSITNIVLESGNNGKLASLTYTEGGKTCTYSAAAGTYTVS